MWLGESFPKNAPAATQLGNLLSHMKRIGDLQIRNIHELYDSHTVLIMEMVLAHDANCVDVGAHSGEILREIQRIAPSGKHFGIEPIPAMALALRTNPDFRSSKIFEVALADFTGQAEFHLVENDPAYSGLKERRYDRADPIVRNLPVNVCRLDDLLEADLPIALIKIDVEGAELQVMKGAQRTISSYKPFIIFESGLGASDRYGTTGPLLYKFLVEACGLEVNTLDGFLAGAPALEESTLDCMFKTTSRYYFIAHRPLSIEERTQIFRSYIVSMDARLFAMEREHRLAVDAIRRMDESKEVVVVDWGGKETTVGVPINRQPDGSSAIWIRTLNVSRLGRISILFGEDGVRSEAFRSANDCNLLTARLPDELIRTPGAHAVIVQESSGRLTPVGFVTVRS